MSRGWDQELVEAAASTVKRHKYGETSTVAAAGRDEHGDIHLAMNVFHFTGGPCAEMVLLGMAAAKGRRLQSIVAVASDDRGVIAPCGRCRQVLLDLVPEIVVLMPEGSLLRPADLLPASYAWEG